MLVDIRLVHRSGVDMNLVDCVNHEDDYTRFQPLIKIASAIMPGSLSRDRFGCMEFSAFPHVPIHLHQAPESIREKVVAVYVGCLNHGRQKEVVFILVEESEEGAYHVGIGPEYRLVGVCSHIVTSHHPDRELVYEHVIDVMQEMSGGQPWRRETLILV